MSSIENNRGRIRKPIAPEVVKYINDPVAKSDYETSYYTYLTINRAHVLMLEKQGIISRDVCRQILKATREIEANPVAPDFTKDSGIRATSSKNTPASVIPWIRSCDPSSFPPNR